MTTTDGQLLLRAIAANPDEDTPRLLYADWLQENGAEPRAEFIRVQCEYWKWANTPFDSLAESQGHWMAWHHNRGGELLRTHESAWRRPSCPKCSGSKLVLETCRQCKGRWDGDRMSCMFCNEGYYERECPTCHGTGSCGPLSGRDEKPPRDGTEWEHDVTWVRGFPVVKCRLEEVGREGLMGHNAGTSTSMKGPTRPWIPTPWAVECVQIGASFEVTDCDPWENETCDPPEFRWQHDKWHGNTVNSNDLQMGELPLAVVLEIAPHPDHATRDFDVGTITDCVLRTFPTQKECLTALNAAVHRLVARAAYPEVCRDDH